MRHVIMLVCLLALGRQASAQDAPAAKETGKASLEGNVVKEPTGEPLKKAIVELIAENQEEGGNYTATSNQEGRFRIANIQPGRYKLFGERPGYIEVDKHRRRSQGVSLSLEPGQELKDEVLHLLAAAIVTGRVLDEDGDPVPGAEVIVWRQTFAYGGRRFETAGSTQTNDLGEYRVGGLLAGKYYLSASAPVNFQSIVPAQNIFDEAGTKFPDTTYVTTYYPGAMERAQAAVLDLHPGDETPVSFSLIRTHAAHLRGSIVGFDAGMKALVMLRSQDTQAIVIASEVDKHGKFDIPHVPPGSYALITTIQIEGETRSGLMQVEVADSDIEGLRLSHSPVATVRGKIHSKNGDTSSAPYVSLRHIDGAEDYSEAFTIAGEGGVPSLPVSRAKSDGSFELKNVTPGIYEVEVSGNSQSAGDSFVESVTVGSKEFVESGLPVNGGNILVDVSLASGAGIVEGSATNEKKEPVANAVVVAVPEVKYRKRKSYYQKATTDQLGRFKLRGLQPGNYTVFAWEMLEEEQNLDPDFLKKFEDQGTPIKVEKGSRQTIALKVIPAAADPP
jgi:protocatechuate 3,4-dioxygenase beta subunit